MGFWEKVLPGYKGYREREDSRNSDKLLREFMSTKLKESRGFFDEVKAGIANRGNLELLNPAEKVTQTLSRVIDRLRYANYGFSGRWFGKDKIGIEHLERVHNFDQKMAGSVDGMINDIRALEKIDDDVELKRLLGTLVQAIRDMDQLLNEREQILRAVGGEPEKR